jgi:cell division septal protein FtsQ
MDPEKWLEQHDRMIADMNNTLRRAIRLGVQDARRQRKRNLEFDEKMARITSMQEQLLQTFLKRGGNGKP